MTQYTLTDKKFDLFSVKFKNTTEIVKKESETKTLNNDSVIHTLAIYETVNNEPHILTMKISSIASIIINIQFDTHNKCIKIYKKYKPHNEEDDCAHYTNNETTNTIDTRLYNHFSVTDVD